MKHTLRNIFFFLVGCYSLTIRSDNQIIMLMNTIKAGQWERAIEYLNDHPTININKIFDDRTLLLTAVENHAIHMVRDLIRRGARTDILHDGYSILHTAAQYGTPEILECLIDQGHMDPNNAPGELVPPLVLAVWAKNAATVSFLIKKGARYLNYTRKLPLGFILLSSSNFETYQAFMQATHHDEQIFLERDCSGIPALHSLLPDIKNPIFKDILSWISPQTLNCRGHNGLTLLHGALAQYPESVEDMLKAGADPFIATSGNVPLLHIAAEEAHIEAFMALYENMKNRRPDILLIPYPKTHDTLAHACVTQDNLALLKQFIAYLEHVESNPNVPVYLRTLHTLQILCQIRNAKKQTLFDTAIQQNAITCFEYLIQKGVPVTNETFKKMLFFGRDQLIQIMLDYGVSLPNLIKRKTVSLTIFTTPEIRKKEGICNACGIICKHAQIMELTGTAALDHKMFSVYAYACDSECQNRITHLFS